MKPRGGVRNPGVVDALVREPGTGAFVLAMLEDRAWEGGDAQRQELREKVASYLKFIGDGQLYEMYPEARERPVRIDLNSVHEPDAAGWELVREIQGTLGKAGIGFEVRLVEAPPPPEDDA